ncbi:MAG: hypothetical protein JWM11_1033 [Planctomycetaceae bacterium]|nr:hypothetical protein [Planctomycetaceae bacterium]
MIIRSSAKAVDSPAQARWREIHLYLMNSIISIRPPPSPAICGKVQIRTKQGLSEVWMRETVRQVPIKNGLTLTCRGLQHRVQVTISVLDIPFFPVEQAAEDFDP